MKVLIFDCRDSFTYNLAHQVREILGPGDWLDVRRNDEIDLGQVEGYDRLILSPGPGTPEETKNLLPLIRRFAASKPILGVCLGHQALGQFFGARLINLQKVFHGVKSKVRLVAKTRLFSGLPEEIEAGRYHSWLVDEKDWPESLLVTARDQSGLVMGLSHAHHDLHGVQFHPESILTPLGPRILANFLEKKAA
ncbi:MAG: aminodeoxychorismate/anthranilate synthase component II [Deltaproteobacteria bacterium]|jgi:anthranilate synthase component 2|nr:aminodeoxychorismate/anthranilate synthase component II [Deltaproteobacteria bacterium]